MHFPDIQNGTAPFEGSQDSPACPYDNSITYMKTGMEQGGMTERGTLKKNCPIATLFTTTSLESKPDL